MNNWLDYLTYTGDVFFYHHFVVVASTTFGPLSGSDDEFVDVDGGLDS